jgi:hypothetical protein
MKQKSIVKIILMKNQRLEILSYESRKYLIIETDENGNFENKCK